MYKRQTIYNIKNFLKSYTYLLTSKRQVCVYMKALQGHFPTYMNIKTTTTRINMKTEKNELSILFPFVPS